MNYDKKSFLAGIGVGRTLKGWAGSGALSMGGGNGYVIYGVLSVSAVTFTGYALPEQDVIYGDFTVASIVFIEEAQ